MSGSTAIVLSNRGYPTPEVSSNFARNLFDWETLSSTSAMPTGGSITRSGLAMLYDSTGKLTYSPNNLLTYSEQFNDASWTKLNSSITANTTTAPDGTTTADKLVEDAANQQHLTYKNYVGTNIKLVASVYAKAAERSFILLQISNFVTSGASFIFNLSDGTYTNGSFGPDYSNHSASIASVGNGWYRISISALKGSFNTTNQFVIGTSISSSSAAYQGNGTSGLFIWGAQLEAATYQTTPSTYVATTASAYYGPRFDYDPVTLQNKGLLVEGTRSNLVTYSEQLNTTDWTNNSFGYSAFGSGSIANAGVSPDGTTTADQLTESVTTNVFVVGQTINVSASTTYTMSVYFKRAVGTRNALIQVNVLGGTTGSCFVWFDLTNVTASTSSTIVGTLVGGTATITSIGNGWYRCAFPVTTNAGNTALTFFPGSYNGARVYAGDGSSALFIWGAQIEAASFPSSYIPTAASSVARAAETFSLTGYANRLVEAYYIDQETGVSSSVPETVVLSGDVTINPPAFGWVTSLRAYTNAYAGSISSPSWLSFSRAGNAMYYDSTGTLTWAPANLLLNSATLSTQTVTVTSGATNILSFSGTGSITYSGAASGTLTGTGANNRVSVVLTMSTTSLTLTVSGTVTNAQLERVTYQTAPSAYIPTTSAAVYGPRYDYDPSTVPATPRGLLIEESRSNICLRSQEFDNAVWSIGNMDAFGSGSVANAIAAPDTTVTADFLRPNTTNSTHFVLQSITTLAGAYSFTVYAKAGGYNFVFLFNGTTANGRVFNIATGAIGGTAGNIAPTSSSITNVGNGWYRCEIVVTATAAANSWRVYPMSSDAASASFAGDGVSGVYLWGAQLEAGAFATSYIPTTTASVTRAADVAQLTGNAQTVLGGTSASVIAEISGTQTSFGQIVNHSGGTLLAKFSSNSQIYATKSDTTSLVASLGSGLNTANFRSAVAFAPNAMSLVANNGTVATAALGIQGAPVTLARLGSATSGFYINSWVTSLAFYNQKLPDAILKQKSTAGAPY